MKYTLHFKSPWWSGPFLRLAVVWCVVSRRPEDMQRAIKFMFSHCKAVVTPA